MPPRKRAAVEPTVKVEPEPVDDSSSSGSECDCAHELSRSECDVDDVSVQVSAFTTLPTTTLLAIAVGVCVRLQAVLAPLAHKPVMFFHGPGGHKRLLRDDIRVMSTARKSLSSALNDLLAVEAVLKLDRHRAVQLLQQPDD